MIRREYFNTVTDQNGSLDSVVYTLISFEVTPVQELSLPVYVRAKRDCTRVFAPMDYVVLNSIIKPNTNIDTLSLKKVHTTNPECEGSKSLQTARDISKT